MTIQVFQRDKPRAFMTAERCAIEEWLNLAQIPDVSVARARVAAGVTTQLHAVTGTREIYIIESGLGVVDDGQRAGQSVSAGDVVLIEASAPQRIRNTGHEELVFLCVCTPRFEQPNYRAR